MKKTLLKVMIGCGLTLTAVQALGSKPYSLNNYKTLDAVVEVAQQESSQSVYTRAYGEKNADEKIRLLEAFIASPEWKGAKEQKNAYSELALVYYSPKGNYDKAMDNATKALSFSDLEAEYQVRMCLTLSACYALHPTKKDMAKGADFANKAFNIASANQNKVNPSYFDAAKQLKDAFAKDLSQKTKKASVSVATPLDNALKLYKQKNYAAAADTLSKLDQNDPKVDYYYGLSLSQIKQYDKAINHLLEASIASPAEYPKARGLAHDFFLANVYKDQKSGKGYNALITDSNTKLVRQEQELAKLRADWNSKYTKEFTDEEWNKVRAEAESKLAVINNMNNQLKKDTATAKDYTNGLTKAADATFEKLVNDAKKRLGK